MREQNCKTACSNDGFPEFSLELITCTRKCLSKECYDELYGQDEVRNKNRLLSDLQLEDGEVDVRKRSFSGCVVNKTVTSL